MSRGNNYLPTLDGWRAVAIAIVLFGHASVQLGVPQFKAIGLLGVQIFFGLSGFLITTLLLREEFRCGSISLVRFYSRRAFRILPAASVFLIVVGILSFAGILDVAPTRWLSSLLFIANYSKAPHSWYLNHFWSLAVEEHFYLIWPPIVVLLRDNRKRLALTIAVSVTIGIWRAVDFKYHLTWSVSTAFWGRTDIVADGIIFGVIAALARERLATIISRPLMGPLAIGLFALTYILGRHVNWKVAFLLLSVRSATVPLMILSTLDRPESTLGRLLELRPIRFLGLISFSLYLWQQMFMIWRPQFAIQHFPVNLAAAFIFAVLSYYLIETPMISLGYRLRNSPTADKNEHPSAVIQQ